MGCFDTVRFQCPKCGDKIDAQTKSGPCDLKTYRSRMVPIEVAGGLVGDSVTCGSCSASWVIGGNTQVELVLMDPSDNLYDE